MAEIRNRLSAVLGEKRMSVKELERRTVQLGRPVSYPTLLDLYHDRLSRIELDILAVVCEAVKKDVGDLLYLDHGNHSEDETESSGEVA
jgi:DNA-binding Xre family transcriptional regulator